jgi:hypothetical protein
MILPYFLSISESKIIFLILLMIGTNIRNSSIKGVVSGINKLIIKQASSMYQGKQQYTIAINTKKIIINISIPHSMALFLMA